MTDSRRRLGLLVPSADVVAEPDFQRFLPDGIVIYTSRAFQRGEQTVSDETLHRIVEATGEAAESLSHARPEVICFACTAASFMHGPGWDRELAERISRAAGGIPALTTSGALIAAMTALGLGTVFMVSPYPEARNEVERHYFIIDFRRGEYRELRTNMTFHVTSLVKRFGLANVGPSETIRVTDDGCEVLTSYEDSVRV